MFEADQGDRESSSKSWYTISVEDSIRRQRVREMIASNQLNTGDDYRMAAMIFHHGRHSADFKIAVSLMEKAIELDTGIDKWLWAAAKDRYLLSVGKPQIYGTQFLLDGDGSWILREMDTTVVTDKERKALGIPTLAEIKLKLREKSNK